jgi:hypothetical protein
MKKWTGTFLALLLMAMLMPVAASAHTGLKSSIPANNETVNERINEIVFDFETVIEPVSKFTVTDDKGVEYPVSDLRINQSQMSGTLAEPLVNGTYTATWKIIGLDGHAVEGSISFRVDAPEPAASTEPAASSAVPPAEPLPEASASPYVDPAVETPDSEVAEPAANAANPSSDASWLFLVLAGAVLVLFVVAVLLKKRRS